MPTPIALLALALGILALSVTGAGAGAPSIDDVVFDADGEPGRVLVQRRAALPSGQTLVLSPNKDYAGRPLPPVRPTHRPVAPRRVRVLFDAGSHAALTIRAGARLVVEGTAAQPVEWATLTPDPPFKPVLTLAGGCRGRVQDASFVNVALQVEGSGHVLSRVSVQYAGDQPAFTFAGAEGSFRRLFAHHSTWGFSFQPLGDSPCDLSIADSCIRSCAKGGPGAFYASGSALQGVPAPGGKKHRVRFRRVDWDPSWDALEGVELQASGSRPRIVAIGDSIVQGSDGYVNFWEYFAGNDDIEHAWPYVLQQRVPRFFVVNKGEGGDTTAGMLGRLTDITGKVKPRLCYLGGGTNDLGGGRTPEQVVASFREMWRRLREADIVPIQLAITPDSRLDDRAPRIVRANALLRQACAESGVRFEDTYTPLLDDAGRGLRKLYDSGDGLHLSKAGYQRVGEFLANSFLELPPVR